ncbi:MAG: hypothetical protein H6750_00390 [Nitrospiraceae bacterium]|nr:hypothetical protein [Nitrospiraceae bacterium]MCW5783616.1 hypothetical protein [Nitrospirales bacterium]
MNASLAELFTSIEVIDIRDAALPKVLASQRGHNTLLSKRCRKGARKVKKHLFGKIGRNKGDLRGHEIHSYSSDAFRGRR